MKRFITSIVVIFSAICMMAQSQGWPANYGGVMLQGFYRDSFSETSWKKLEKQANQFAGTFDLVWIPQSGNCGGTSMGYDDLYWFDNYNSSFGAEIELRSMINAFKDRGIGTIADVVINHRRNVSNWVDFPIETYKGETYEMKSTDICWDDDGGDTFTWANNNGYSISNNPDTGEGWPGMRDLDHKSTNVQTIVKAYLDKLINDFGYAGFRYDMVLGYDASYTKMYNESAKPQFSVGENWSSSNVIKNWIDGTDKTSAAFDFQFRYTVRNAANNGDWSKLAAQNDGNWPLISDNFENGAYRQWAVTFVENHDTEKRPNDDQDPIKKDTLAANAYLLAMPGTPCVFYTHWKAYPKQIKQMVHVRKFAGITNTNVSVQNVYSQTNRAVRNVKIDNQYLLCVAVGSGAAAYSANANLYQQVLSGYHFKYFLAKRLEKPFVDMPSGEYEESFKATMYALSQQSGASLVYTTDGSDPTASSTQASNGTEITISQNCTLKVGLLVGTEVSAIQTYTYTFKEEEIVEIPPFCTVEENEVCAFFEAPSSWTGTVKCWAWSESPEYDNFTGGSWPGVACTLVGEANNGKKVWKWTWDGIHSGSSTQPQKVIFSINTGTPQTENYGFATGGYYDDEKLLAVVTPTGIEAIAVDAKTIETNSKVYTLDGRLLNTTGSLDGLRKGIYIVGGKKVIK